MSTVTKIVQHYGGPDTFAKAISAHRTRVYEWMRSGRVPPKRVRAFITLAEQAGFQVTAADLLPELQAEGRAA